MAENIVIVRGHIKRQVVAALLKEAFPKIAPKLTVHAGATADLICFPDIARTSASMVNNVTVDNHAYESGYGHVYSGRRTVIDFGRAGQPAETMAAILKTLGGFHETGKNEWSYTEPTIQVKDYLPVDPKDQLKVALSRSLTPSQTAVLDAIIDNDDLFASVQRQMNHYAAEKANLNSVERTGYWPSERNLEDGRVALVLGFEAKDGNIELLYTMPDEQFTANYTDFASWKTGPVEEAVKAKAISLLTAGDHDLIQEFEEKYRAQNALGLG